MTEEPNQQPDLRYPGTTKIFLIVGCALFAGLALIIVGGYVVLIFRSPTPDGIKSLETMAVAIVGFLAGGFMAFVRDIIGANRST